MSDTEFEAVASTVDKTEEIPELEDLPIACIDCVREFIWTAGEQTFFHDKGLQNPPKRCKECKKAKNLRLAAIELSRSNGTRYKFEIKADCASCGEATTVPFYPSQGRPVYCRTCFAGRNIGAAGTA